MKFIALVISVFTICEAIRVPTSWTNSDIKEGSKNKLKDNHRPTIPSLHISESVYQQRHQPLRYSPNFKRIKYPPARYKNRPHNFQKFNSNYLNIPKNYFSAPISRDGKLEETNEWIPILPQNQQHLRENLVKLNSDKHPHRDYKLGVLNKNYRDDKTHEPHLDYENYDTESIPSVQRKPDETSPLSSHEIPLDIPTMPIYPGEGLWAQRGRKYKPFISRHRYADLKEIDEKPEGYETFQGIENVFNNQRKKFANELNEFPEKHELGAYIEPSSDHNEGEESEENSEIEFVPMQLYSQVRRTENEEHLPKEDASDEKLRELIKDSKIQTVYTEEGYEDTAYDHAGHEKKAEEDEGFAEFDKEIEKEKEQKVPKDLYKLVVPGEDNVREDSNEVEDSEIGESNFRTEKLSGRIDENKAKIKPPNMKMKKNNFIKTKETKTMEVKEKPDGNVEMEISTEVKVVATPHNGTKAHKYVKIFPKRIVVTKLEPNEETVTQNVTNIISDSEVTISSILTLPPVTELPDLVTVEIPTPSSSTPAIVPILERSQKNVDTETAESVLSKINQAFLKINPQKVLHRQKRFSNDFHEIKAETDFIHDIKDIPQMIKDNKTKEKYPYYDTDINPDSALRYSEDLANIPTKTGTNMAFYEKADKTECPEVETDIDPIPERVKNADQRAEEEEETTDVAELAESPRLGMLGDKIDCFKKKYFGDNPLDSPIFNEEIIEPVSPIFKTKSQNIIATTVSTKDSTEDIDMTIKKLSHPIQESHSINNVEENMREKLNDVARIQNTEINVKMPDAKLLSEEQPEVLKHKIDGNKTKEQVNNDELNIGLNILSDIINKMDINNGTKTEEVIETPKDVEIVNIETLPIPTEIPMINLITTPNYTIDLKPKHIYDQIELLQYLPLLNNSASQYVNYKIINETQSSNGTVERIGRDLDLSQNTTISNTTVVSNKTQSEIISNNLPESQALKKKRRRVIRPRRPYIHIFDINRYIPTTPFPYLRPVNYNMPLPKYKVFSEVHYKDEIKPNEQLNVFADIINNIKNSSAKDPLVVSASQDHNQIAVKLNTFIPKDYKNRFNKPPRNFYPTTFDNSYLNNIEETNSFYLTTSTTTLRPIIAQTMNTMHTSHNSHKTNNNLYKDLMVTLNGEDDVSEEEIEAQEIDEYAHKELEKLRKNRKPIMKIPTLRTVLKIHTTTTEPYDNDKSGSEIKENNDYIDQPLVEVVGLVPPDNKYKTIYNPQTSIKLPNSIYSVIEEPKLNNFYVPGMKPPINQKALLYSDFKLENSNKIRRQLGRPIRRRGKRSPAKNYSEVSRSRGPQFQGEGNSKKATTDDDDYVPHRPKNYHYDEKTGRIVYDNPKKEEPEELEYVEVYEEDTETPTISRKKSKTTTTTSIPWIATITTDKNEPSLLVYLEKLRKDPNYKLIPDPTTTEKDKESEKTTEKLEIVTAQTSSTNAPEFLNILSKIRSDSHYKLIEDKKPIKVSTTTEETILEEEEVIEESKLENVQNSPGGQAIEHGQNLDVFDISDFLPKVKNYQPRTSIDYSKYKTIERPTVRHNLSSRYNSDDDQPLEEVNTKRIPIISEKKQEMDDRNFDVNEPPLSSRSTTEQIILSKRPTTLSTTTSTPELTETVNSTPSRFRNRQRKRPQTTPRLTTPRPIRRTTSQTPNREEQENNNVPAQNDKAKRVYTRRRPTRIKVRTTTEHYENQESADDTTKIIRRRHQTETTIINNNHENIPSNHKPKFTPIIVRDRIDEELLHTKSKPHDQFKRTAKIQTPNEFKINTNISEEQISKPGKIEPRKINVEIFQTYDKNKKHGGNYKRINEHNVIPENSEDFIERLTDVVPNPIAFYTDPKLAKNVNQLREYNSEETEQVLESDNVGVEELDDNIDNVDENSTDYYDEVRINFGKKSDNDQEVKESSTTTASPVLFIKDPSRRLYYYATI